MAPGERSEPAAETEAGARLDRLRAGPKRSASTRPAAESAPIARIEAVPPTPEPTLRPTAFERPIPLPFGALRSPPQTRVLQAPFPDPGPTVHVTIGRIEVRAEPNAPPPRRERKRSQQMTLEEYLRRRSEAAR